MTYPQNMLAMPPLPTREDILAYGPPLKTWPELKEIIGSGELGRLHRIPALQARYDLFTAAVRKEYGTVEKYLLTRLPALTPPSPGAPPFNPSTPKDQYCALMNDWPYALPFEVEHYVVWTSAGMPELGEKGVWGFTGTVAGCKKIDVGAGEGIAAFVRERWPERQWETAWFVNPPRLQSVKGLSHFHVFARPKAPEEEGRSGEVLTNGHVHTNGHAH